ncbi:DUF5068 domain-containing protein [Enterococcus sp. BWT-B8]|uniref:DUF5068 domain-containing protein n=1 Tax=Enterococcus sp. BWT-B8 TaxID=2885157 RepID=UPI001E2A8744|nr:DUF5068 domain-containing protein [Enterococcus sp. BWT-B8]MCB5951350.1 DUF5068 domain-containing protein [Enterococcus sp. BWT-B8]
MKKIILALLLSAVVLGACDNGKKETKESSSQASTEEVSNSSSIEESTTESSSIKKNSSSTSKLSERAEMMEEYLGADTAELLYSQTKPVTVEIEDLTLSIDEYDLVEFTDFDSDFEIPFGGQTVRGAVMLATISITNNSDKTLYYPTVPDLTFTGATKAYTNNRTVVEDSDDNYGAMSVKSKGEVGAGETVTATLNYIFDENALDTISDLGIVTMNVPRGFTKAESFSAEDSVGTNQKIQLTVTADGEDTASANASFLQDKASTDDMGTKTLDKEKKAIGKTESVDGIDATLSEYQFTFFEPNEMEAARFSNFENGVVLLTVKFDVDNQGEKPISMSSTSAVLTVNNGSQRILSEGMLLSYTTQTIEPGKQKELLQVFAMDQEQYEKIWREKDFGLKLNLVNSEDFKRSSVEFDLPK